ncbi:MAG: hypothetical protein U0840_21240 [Gemmataceae bacterium]
MSSTWNTPDRDPLGRDPELDVLARLFRDHPPAEPTAADWFATQRRIESALIRPLPAPRRPRWPALVGLITAAAALVAGVVSARALWPTLRPADPETVQTAEDDSPFPVASMSEVNIIRMDPRDADRVAAGQSIFGTLDLASTSEIVIFQATADPGNNPMPVAHRRAEGGPMIIVSRLEEANAIEEDLDP